MSISKETNLIIRLREDVTKLRADQRKAMSVMRKHKSELSGIGKQMSATFVGAFSAYAALATIKDMTAAYDKQEKAIAQVRQGLITTGAVSGKTLDELRTKAADLQKNTLFGDEEILSGATAQLLTFTNIANKEFDRTQKAILDVATRLDQDLKSTAIQLGKALNDPVANLGALGRSGIQFSKDQKAVIKDMAETNRLAEAQAMILEELEKQYGGSAEAAAAAGTGGFKQLSNTIGDLGEEIGALLVEGSSSSGFLGWLKEITQEATKATHALRVGAKGTYLEEINSRLSLLGNTQGSLDTLSVLIKKAKDEQKKLNEELKKSEERGYLYSGVADTQRNSIDLLTTKIGAYKARTIEISTAIEAQAAATKKLADEQRKLANVRATQVSGSKNITTQSSLSVPGLEGVTLPDLSIPPGAFDEAIEKNKEEFRRYREYIVTEMDLLNQEMSAVINDTLAATIAGIANILGSGSGLEAGFKAVMGIIAAGMDQIGKAMIGYGIAQLGFQTALKSLNPIGAIAAGSLMVAAASALQAANANFASTASGGSGASGPTGRFQSDRTGQSQTIKLHGEFEISGRTAKALIDQESIFDQRNVG